MRLLPHLRALCDRPDRHGPGALSISCACWCLVSLAAEDTNTHTLCLSVSLSLSLSLFLSLFLSVFLSVFLSASVSLSRALQNLRKMAPQYAGNRSPVWAFTLNFIWLFRCGPPLDPQVCISISLYLCVCVCVCVCVWTMLQSTPCSGLQPCSSVSARSNPHVKL
jgi:phosphatidylglycerophosphate synthase